MDVQTIIVLAIVGGCVLYVGRNFVAVLTGRGKKSCHGCHAGCATPTDCSTASTENRASTNVECEGSEGGV